MTFFLLFTIDLREKSYNFRQVLSNKIFGRQHDRQIALYLSVEALYMESMTRLGDVSSLLPIDYRAVIIGF